ncbi:uncharacterized protein [Nicotiana sylvestris]|uniref:uncharacterized protein n=1 Tax=Nicotiana sylvestris TaxID=4096 RepID=UPI00388CE01F
MDPLKYIFQKPMPTDKLAKWQILLSEFDIVYVTQKAVKGQALADHLAKNPVGGEYKRLKTYFPDEEELRKRFRKKEFQHTPRVQNEFTDALATLSSMIQHPDTNFIDPIQVKIHDQPAYCAHVEEEADGKPWFHDIRKYLTTGEYPELANATQKRTLRRLSNNFFHSGGILYRRTPDMGLLRCVEARGATKLLEEVHVGTCGPHMNGFVLAKKILRAGYFWMTMEVDCIQHVRRCHRCQIHADMIKVPPNELTATSSPCIIQGSHQESSSRFRPRSYGLSVRGSGIITDNCSNLNSDLMKAMCETFKIKHKNSTAYRPQMNGVVEAANKNIKKILRKMIEKHKQWQN